MRLCRSKRLLEMEGQNIWGKGHFAETKGPRRVGTTHQYNKTPDFRFNILRMMKYFSCWQERHLNSEESQSPL